MSGGEVFRFGRFELRPDAEELRKNGVAIHLPHQPLRILTLLIARAGEIVTREEIRAAVWGDETFVDYEQGINTAIRQIRHALNDTAEAPRFLQTVPRRGYRFIAAVERIVPEELLATFEAAVVPPAEPLVVIEAAPAKQRRVRRRDVAAVAVALLVAFVAFALVRTRDEREDKPGVGIAVMPFRSIGRLPIGVDARSYTEELTTRVTQLHPERIRAGALGDADVLIEGTLQRSPGDHVRVIVRGVDARTRAQLWAETYERADAAVVAFRITRLLAQKHLPEPRFEPLVRTNVSPEARELYKQARIERNRPRAQRDLDRALRLFHEALKLEPKFAEAWSGIGDIHAERRQLEQARAALNRAIQLDPKCAEGHNDLALILMEHDHAYGPAEDALRRALAADPEYIDAHFNLAVLLTATGQHEAAIAEMRRVQQLAPLRFVPSIAMAVMYFHARRFDEAEAEYRACVAMQQNVTIAKWGLRTIEVVRDAKKGLTESFRQSEKALKEEWRAGRIDDYILAAYYAQRCDHDRAFELLDSAIAKRAPLTVYLYVDPRFDNLREDPRFAARLKALRFET
jgi:DNA-binding winged helix-turn-helix (wHTH) protein/tetratricopeptide (TPR) repeat protein